MRFIRAYEAEGIPIYAITVQNEPGVDRAIEKDPTFHYPSCRWAAEQERDFIRDHLLFHAVDPEEVAGVLIEPILGAGGCVAREPK